MSLHHLVAQEEATQFGLPERVRIKELPDYALASHHPKVAGSDLVLGSTFLFLMSESQVFCLNLNDLFSCPSQRRNPKTAIGAVAANVGKVRLSGHSV